MNRKQEFIYNLIVTILTIILIILVLVAINIFIFKPSINWYNGLSGIWKFLVVIIVFINIKYLIQKLIE